MDRSRAKRSVVVLALGLGLIAAACGETTPTGRANADSATEDTAQPADRVVLPAASEGRSLIDGPGGAYALGGAIRSGTSIRPMTDVAPVNPDGVAADDLPIPDGNGFVPTAGMTSREGIFVTGLTCSWKNMEIPGCNPSAETSVSYFWSFQQRSWVAVELPAPLVGTVAMTMLPLADGRYLVLGGISDEGASLNPTPSKVAGYIADPAKNAFVEVNDVPTQHLIASTAGVKQACVSGNLPVVVSTTGSLGATSGVVSGFDGVAWTTLFAIPDHDGFGTGAVLCSDSDVLVVVPDKDSSRVFRLDPARLELQDPEPLGTLPTSDISQMAGNSRGDRLYIGYKTGAESEISLYEPGADGFVVPPTRLASREGGAGALSGRARLIRDGERLIAVGLGAEVAIVQ